MPCSHGGEARCPPHPGRADESCRGAGGSAPRSIDLTTLAARKTWRATKLTELIAKTFDLKGMDPVIFTDRTAKTPFFRQVHAQVSYGDSDGDIRDSIAAGARPVRVTRARNSVNEDPTHDGAFGEEVLIDSAD